MWGDIIGGAGSLFGFASARSAARKQKKLNKMNITSMEETNREEQRRLQSEITDSESLMGAMSAASGVQSTGSRGIAIADTKKPLKLADSYKLSNFKIKRYQAYFLALVKLLAVVYLVAHLRRLLK